MGNRSAVAFLLGLAGIAAAASLSLSLSLSPQTAHAAVPDYRVVQIPSPQPQANSNFGERLRALGDVDGDHG